MKRISIIAGAIVAILLLAAFIVPRLVPTSVYKTQIETAATKALGREVTLDGEARLSIFPRISARIEGAKIANPEGFSAPYMVEAGALSGTVKLLPLLTRKVEIGQITLSDATIRLEQLENGENNWTFFETDAEGAPQPDPASEETGGGFETGIDRARLQNTSISYVDRATGTQYALDDFNASLRLTAFDAPLSSSGDGILNGQAFDYDIKLDAITTLTAGNPSTLDANLETDFGEIGFDGEITLADIPALNGAFKVRSETIGELIQFLGTDLPIRGSELQSIRAEGTIAGAITNPSIQFDLLDIGATGVDFSFGGLLDLTAAPAINGNLDLRLDRPQRLLKEEVPGLEALSLLEDFRMEGDVSGGMEALSLTNMTIEQSSDLLSVDFSGDLSLAETGQTNGTLEASSSDMRGLLALLGTQMAPGDTLQSFDIKGNVSGSQQQIGLTDASITLDDLTGTGDVGVDLGATRPKLTADLTMPALDLTPFLGSPEGSDAPTSAPSEDWSDDPLALEGLNAVDADVRVNAGMVKIGEIELADALLATQLNSGRLNTSFKRDDQTPGFKAFDGNWSGALQLDAGRATPTLALQANADSVAAQKLLSALAGYGGLAGIGGLNIDLTSSGNSLKALINGLDGSVNSSIANGELAGVNLAQMVRSASNLQSAFQSGGLSVASFREAISPEAETDFSSLISGLTFDNGVATIQALDLSNPVVAVTGSGTIDLGARTLNVRLVPSVDTAASGQGSSLSIDDIPVPVRISGSWSAPSFGIDTAFVQAELTSRLTGQVENRLRDELGGALGRAFGNQDNAQSTELTDSDDKAPAEEEERSLEDQLVDEALGSIFGRR